MIGDAVHQFLKELRVYDVGPGLTKTRLGGANDGGYVVMAELIRSSKALYSYGIGTDVAFELDFLDRAPAALAWLFDPTIEAPPVDHPRFRFRADGAESLGLVDELPRHATLKLDAEHAEWRALQMVGKDALLACLQIVVEVHMVHAEPRQGLTPYFERFYQGAFDRMNALHFLEYARALSRLNRYFWLAHLHPNNSLPPIVVGGRAFPPLLELTFVRKDLVSEARPADPGAYPVQGLDAPNKLDRPDVRFRWGDGR